MATTQDDRIAGISSGVAIKAPARVATTANIVLSGLQTIDGVSVVAGDRVLVKDQTDQTQNGIYVANTSAWTRDFDFDGARDVVKGTAARINEGSANVGKWFSVTTADPITIGTSNIAFSDTLILGTTSVPVVETSIAALKALSGAQLQGQVQTLGYYTAGDGGGGLFFWNSTDITADNGGTVIAPNAGGTGRWNRLTNGLQYQASWFGAKGDGTDDTSFINSAITALPTYGVLDGNGKQYTVTSLNLKSYMRLQNIRFLTLAGSTDFVSPVTVNGTSSSKTDIYLENVFVNGNRQNQTLIGTTTENGGRHGFRILGNVANLTVLNCGATYCAGDGLELYSNSVSSNDATFAFSNIAIINFNAKNNRRHGISADSINGVVIVNPIVSNNGLDLNGTDPLTSGNRGARSGGNLFGNGIDFEGYGVGSCILDLTVIGGEGLGNARSGLLFVDPVKATDANFVARRNIKILGGHYDGGVDSSAELFAVGLTQNGGFQSLGAIYTDVTIHDNDLDGYILFRAVNRAEVDGGYIDYNGGGSSGANDAFILDYGTGITIGAIQYKHKSTVSAGNSTYRNELLTVFGTSSTQRIAFGTTDDGTTTFQVGGTIRLTGSLSAAASNNFFGVASAAFKTPSHVGNGDAIQFTMWDGSTDRLALTLYKGSAENSLIVGRLSALATTATDGFLYLPTCAGTPTGVPTSQTGKVPMIFDTTGVKLWVYTGGAWKGVVVA